jgi:hypothetical protein
LAAKRAELDKALAEDMQRRDALQAQYKATQAQIAATAPPQPEPAPAAGSPRAAEAVAAAVRSAPGLEDANPDVRARLVAQLEAGACVVPALKATLGEVNRQTAAALIRGLGDCQ